MFTKISHILPETVKKNGMASHVTRARVIDMFQDIARQTISEASQGGFKILKYTEGTLTIACRSTAIAAELRRHEAAFLEGIKSAGGERLRFLLSSWR